MMLSIGEKIILPSHGPCRIGAVVKKVFAGKPASFYPLAVMDDSGNVLFVPVDKIEALGIRQLMEKSEIPKLLRRLSGETKPTFLPTTARNWKRRVMDNSKLLASGLAINLVELVESLTDLSKARALASQDRQTLDRAKKLLVCEIAEVLGDSRSAVAERIDRALGVRKARKASGHETN